MSLIEPGLVLICRLVQSYTESGFGSVYSDSPDYPEVSFGEVSSQSDAFQSEVVIHRVS